MYVFGNENWFKEGKLSSEIVGSPYFTKEEQNTHVILLFVMIMGIIIIIICLTCYTFFVKVL